MQIFAQLGREREKEELSFEYFVEGVEMYAYWRYGII